MTSLETRKLSFIDKGWDQSIPISVDKLSEAGFYYTGTNDFVKCFSCSGVMSKWAKEDDPFTLHMTHFPDCHFVKLNKTIDPTNIANESTKIKFSQYDSEDITSN
jgi:hypothetical protein